MSTDARTPNGIARASLHSFRLRMLPRRHVLNFSSLVASQGIRMGSGLLFWLVAGHLAPPHEVGLAAAAFAALLICVLISALGFGPAIIRLQSQYRATPGAILRPALVLVTASAGVVSAGFIALASFGFEHVDLVASASFAPLFLATCIAGTVASVMDDIFVAKWRAHLVFMRAGLAGLLTLGSLAVVVISVDKITAPLLFSCWCIGFVGSALIGLVCLRHDLRNQAQTSMLASWQLIRTGLANHALTVAEGVPSLAIPLVVTELISPEANAYWYAVWLAALGVFMFPGFSSMLLFAEASDPGIKLREAIRYRLAFGLILGIAVAALVALVAHAGLRLLGDDYAREGATPLRILVVGVMPIALVQAYNAVARVRYRLPEATLTAVAVGALMLAGTGVTATNWGLNGIALNWLLIYACASLWCLWRIRRIIRHDASS